MKRIILSTIILASLLIVNTSCKKEKDTTDKTTEEVVNDVTEKTENTTKNITEKTEDVTTEETGKAVDLAVNKEQLEKGKEVFTAKGCVACHQTDKKVIGPSLQEIAKIYADKNGNMVKFLKGNADAIVDTDPAQVAIMKANIAGILKGMSAEDLQAITAYIRSTAK